MTLSPKVEAALQAELKKRSNPAAVTDYKAGTLSDERREEYLRYWITGLDSEEKQLEEIREMTDKGILYLDGMGL